MKINACGASHLGNHRKHNEDNIYVDGSFRNDVTMNNMPGSSRILRKQRSSLKLYPS